MAPRDVHCLDPKHVDRAWETFLGSRPGPLTWTVSSVEDKSARTSATFGPGLRIWTMNGCPAFGGSVDDSLWFVESGRTSPGLLAGQPWLAGSDLLYGRFARDCILVHVCGCVSSRYLVKHCVTSSFGANTVPSLKQSVHLNQLLLVLFNLLDVGQQEDTL